MIVGIEVGYNDQSIVVYENGQVKKLDNIPDGVTECVAIVPTMYTPMEKQALKSKMSEAGVKVVKTINRTTASILAYDYFKKNNLERANEEEKIVLSVDAGDGHVDVEIAEVNAGVIEIVSVCGDAYEEGKTDGFAITEVIRKTMMKCIEESNYEGYEIDEVLVNGKVFEKEIGEAVEKISKGATVCVDSKLCNTGAAILAMIFDTNADMVITEVSPYYVGFNEIEWNGDDNYGKFTVFVKKNVTFPKKITKIFDHSWGRNRRTICLSKDIYGSEIIEIGMVSYVVPDVEQNNCKVQESIMYDADGMIYYQGYIPEIDKEYNFVLNADKTEAIISLDKVGQKIRDFHMEEKKLIAEAEELYTECDEKGREELGAYIGRLEAAMIEGDLDKIKQAREKLEYVVERYNMDLSEEDYEDEYDSKWDALARLQEVYEDGKLESKLDKQKFIELYKEAVKDYFPKLKEDKEEQSIYGLSFEIANTIQRIYAESFNTIIYFNTEEEYEEAIEDCDEDEMSHYRFCPWEWDLKEVESDLFDKVQEYLWNNSLGFYSHITAAMEKKLDEDVRAWYEEAEEAIEEMYETERENIRLWLAEGLGQLRKEGFWKKQEVSDIYVIPFEGEDEISTEELIATYNEMDQGHHGPEYLEYLEER